MPGTRPLAPCSARCHRASASTRGEGARAVVHVPVECLGQHETLGRFEFNRHNIVDVDDHACKPHSTPVQAKLMRLLDAVDRVRAGIGQRKHFRTARLRLNEKGGEIRRRWKRIRHRPSTLPPAPWTKRGVAFHGVTEGVIRGEKEPCVAPRAHHRLAGRVSLLPRTVRPVNEIGRAGLAGQVGERRPGVELGLILPRRSAQARVQPHCC